MLRVIIGSIGYLLSPLSWWNDAFINIPLAYGLAWIINKAVKGYFEIYFIFFYWVTNILGLILLGLGMFDSKGKKKRSLKYYFMVCLIYSLLIAALMRFSVTRPMLYPR